MPAPSYQRNGAEKRDPRQRLLDAGDLFEGHLAGLVKAFQLYQQHSYELLEEPLLCGGERPKTSHLEALLPVKPSPRAAVEMKPAEPEEKSARAQFERLMEQEKVTLECLMTVLRCYHPDQELEDLPGLVPFLHLDERSKEEEELKPRRWLQNQSTSRDGLSLELLHLKLDFEAFLRLRSAAVEERGALQRDLTKLRSALRSEELQALFKDEPHMEEAKASYVLTTRQQRCLEFVPAMVIVLNSISFAFQDLGPGNNMWEIIENIFLAFYISEAMVKIWLMGCYGYFRGPEWAWNWFDFLCILISVVDLGVTQAVALMGQGQSVDLSILMLLKMLRLCRLARLIRALRYPLFRELNMMVMGVISGFRVLIWAIVLLMSFVYAVGVALFKLIGSEHQEFESLQNSMLTLFRCFTDGCTAFDGTPLQDRLQRQYGWWFFLGYILVFMLVTVGIFNLIMAIFIDNVMTNQQERVQRDLSETADETEVALKENLCRLLSASKSQLIPSEVSEEIKSIGLANLSRKARVRAQFDCLSTEEVVISRDAFRVWLQDEEFLQVLEHADIDIHNKATLFDIMDADMGGSLSTFEVFQGLMQLRGPPTKGDIVGISLRVTHIAQLLQEMGRR